MRRKNPIRRRRNAAAHSSVAFLCLAASVLSAQTDSRVDEIEKARQEKALSLTPETTTKIEDQLRRLREDRYVDRLMADPVGWYPSMGSVGRGSGFAIGPGYTRKDLWDGKLHFNASAQASIKHYVKFENEWTLPHVLRDKGYLSFHNVYQNLNAINYYGVGPDSAKSGRSNYRLEDTSTELIAAIKPGAHFKVGATLGYSWYNVGPGKDSALISSEKQYFPADSPGIGQQTNFQRNGVFIQRDTRDNPGGPKIGGNYLFQYTWFDDRKLDRFNFRRMDIEVQQFFPIFNRTRVFAFRAKTVLTETNGQQSMPFYLMPTLGGSNDLRGFRPYRFRDRNAMVMNAEYRWHVFDGMDGAVFADAGKVFSRRGQLNFKDLESSVGFGLRFNARNTTFLRFDAGFSHEGFQLWVKFNDIFAQRPFGASLAQPVLQ